ncbi:hypothetical protein ACHAWX_006322 [Stephanocyclus meneghinianus]
MELNQYIQSGGMRVFNFQQIVNLHDNEKTHFISFVHLLCFHTVDQIFIVYHASLSMAIKGNQFFGLFGNGVCVPNASNDKLKKMDKLNDAKSSIFVSVKASKWH